MALDVAFHDKMATKGQEERDRHEIILKEFLRAQNTKPDVSLDIIGPTYSFSAEEIEAQPCRQCLRAGDLV